MAIDGRSDKISGAQLGGKHRAYKKHGRLHIVIMLSQFYYEADVSHCTYGTTTLPTLVEINGPHGYALQRRKYNASSG